MNNKRTLECLWDDVSKKLGYPNIKMPEIVFNNSINTAEINMGTKEIFISSKFIRELNLPIETAYIGISAHEANHYVTCPFDLYTMLVLESEISKVDATNKKDLNNYFEDVIINLDLIVRGVNEISEVYKAMNSNHVIDETIKAFYYLRTNIDFGARQKDKISLNAIKSLDKLNYSTLDIDSLKKNAYKFAKIMSPLLKYDKQLDEKNLINRSYAVLGGLNSTSFSEQDVYNASKELTKDLSPKKYKQVVNGFSNIFSNEQLNKLGKRLKDYYRKLSENYSIIVKSKKNGFSRDCVSYSTKKWEIGDEFTNIDYFKSYGKIFPNMTREKTFTTIINESVVADNNNLPEALVIIDSSISMANPENERSYAVLGGYCTANYYLKHGRKVGVINFSSDTVAFDYSFSKEQIYDSILLFQAQGTSLDLGVVNKMIKSDVDVYLISDMGIEDFDKTFNYFKKQSKTKRTNFYLINSEVISNQGKINIFEINNEKDIPKIIIDNLNKR